MNEFCSINVRLFIFNVLCNVLVSDKGSLKFLLEEGCIIIFIVLRIFWE